MQRKTENWRKCEISGRGTNPGAYELQMAIKSILPVSFNKKSLFPVDLGIRFQMVFESPQSELRFESYGQNSKNEYKWALDAPRIQFLSFPDLLISDAPRIDGCAPHPVLSFFGLIIIRCAPHRWMRHASWGVLTAGNCAEESYRNRHPEEFLLFSN